MASPPGTARRGVGSFSESERRAPVSPPSPALLAADPRTDLFDFAREPPRSPLTSSPPETSSSSEGRGAGTRRRCLRAPRASLLPASDPRPPRPRPSELRPSESRPSEPRPSEPRPSELRPSEPRTSEPRTSDSRRPEPRPLRPRRPKPWSPSVCRLSSGPWERSRAGVRSSCRSFPWVVRVVPATSVSPLTSSVAGSVLVVVRTVDLPPCGPRKRPNKISKSNTVSIELPYDVVHHAAVDFEEDSNNCLKMIFNRDTVAVCDMRTTDREVRR